MNRRSGFRGIAATLAAPALVAGAAVQNAAMGAQATAYKVGHLFFDNKAVPGSVHAYVWSGRAWVGLDPTKANHPAMRKAVQWLERHMKPDELSNLAVRVNGEWEWASKYLGKQ